VRLISWILSLIIAVAAVLFAVSNRAAVTLDFWPFPFSLDVPTYLTVLGGLLVGFVVGGFLGWAPMVTWKTRARMRASEIQVLRARAERLDKRVKELETSAKQAENPAISSGENTEVKALPGKTAA